MVIFGNSINCNKFIFKPHRNRVIIGVGSNVVYSWDVLVLLFCFNSMTVTMLFVTCPYLYETWEGVKKSNLYSISLVLPSVFSCVRSIFVLGLHFCLVCSFPFGFWDTKYMLTRVWRVFWCFFLVNLIALATSAMISLLFGSTKNGLFRELMIS